MRIFSFIRIVSYLITLLLEGFKEAAEKFRSEAGVEPAVPLSTLDDRILIREAVQNGRVQEATHLVNKLHPWLLDNDRYLYFHLQQLHLIELIRLAIILCFCCCCVCCCGFVHFWKNLIRKILINVPI